MMAKRGCDIKVAALCLLMAATAIIFLLWLMSHGVGLYYDSMPYLESAENLLAGQGLGRSTCETFKPLTRYPPLYSLVLAALSALQVNIIEGARWLNALFLGAACGLVAATLWRATRNWPATVAGAILTAVSTPVLKVFTWAMSEPLYLCLWLASTLTLDSFLTGGKRRELVASAILTGLAFLTRYVGGVLVAVAELVLALWAWRKRASWKGMGIYLALACIPMLVWLGRGLLVSDNPTSRDLAFHPPDRFVMRDGAETVIGWFGTPDVLRSEEAVAAIGAGIAIGFAALLVLLARKRAFMGGKSRVFELHLLTSVLYVGSVLVSVSFFDSKTPLDDRILISTYISMGIVLLIAMDRALKHRAPGAAVLAATALLVLVGRQVDQLGATVARLRRDGQGYAAARWQESDTAHSLVALRPTVIYTNDITAVYFVAGYPSCGIPTRGAEAALDAMQRDLGREGAVLAIFGDLSSEFMPEEKLTDGLVAIWTFDDGRIYQAHEQ